MVAPDPMSDPHARFRPDEAPTSSSLASQPSQAPLDFPRAGRYRIECKLGAGGMAEVYKAHDPELGRDVALKFLRGDDPGLLARFQHEARAQARLEHEHICKVYEVGEAEGRRFIAMQYVSGQSLKDAAKQMSLEQKVDAVRIVANAVHAAHKVGLIHRDIKPGNVMVESREAGGWHPYVMDFGIARDQAAEGLTVTGMIVGTPGYMAPEQLRGKDALLDRRADVYGLGATLYALLTGHPPFGDEASVDVMVRVLEADPPSLVRLNRDIPPDLDTVVMKCLQKEPNRRYDSAKALADDLQRYLDGDPILARRTSISYRLVKKARKNRALVASLSLAVALLLLLAGATVRARWAAARQEELGRHLGQEIKEIESLMRIAHLLPLHDTRAERALVRKKMASIEKDHLDGEGRGPAAYALGKGHLALGDEGAARRYLERAWNAGYRRPEVAYALGLVMGTLYQRGLQEAARSGDKEVVAARRTAAAREYGSQAREYLKQSRGAELEAPEYLEALLAFHEERYAQALDKARAAFALQPRVYEARVLEGQIHETQGDGHAEAGRYDAARQSYALAEAAYRSAMEIAHSDPRIPESLAALDLTRMETEIYGENKGLAEDFASGMAACALALQANPDSPEALRLQAGLIYRMAEYERNQGGDPRPLLAKAIEAAGRSAALRPAADTYLTVVEAHRVQAAYELDRGIDPSQTVRGASEAYQQAVRLDPTDPGIHNSVGIAFRAQGGWEARSGRDPRPFLQKAVDAYGESIRRNPRYSYAYNNAGNAWAERAAYELDHGIDPSASVAEVRRLCEKASEINPNYPYPYNNVASAYCVLARHQMRRGLDPRPSLAQAIGAAREGTRVSASFAPIRGNLARAYAIQAEYEWSQSVDPAESAQISLEAGRQALALNPKMAAVHGYLAWAHLVLARQALEPDPRPSLARALEASQNALAANPRYAEGHLLEGLAWLLEAEWRTGRKQSPEPALARAREKLSEAARIKPDEPRVPLALAEASLWQARWLQTVGRSAEGELSAGLQRAREAAALDPSLAEATALMGVLQLVQSRGASGRQALQEALAANRNLTRRYQEWLASDAKRDATTRATR